MKELTSKKTGKAQIVSDEVWENIVKRGWTAKYTVKDIQPKKLNTVTPIVIKKTNGKNS